MFNHADNGVVEVITVKTDFDARVWVLLATYNGADYLQELLDSLLRLEGGGWSLVAYDDGSSDKSTMILEAFKAAHPERVSHMELSDRQKPLGPSKAFSHLVERASQLAKDDDLIVFADQDDVWSSEKLTLLISRYKDLSVEERCRPVLLHSDLEVVDSEGRRVSASLMRLQNTNPEQNHLPHLLAQNTVTGCAMMVNLALLRKAAPIPKSAIMHDWWFGLVAAATGQILYLSEPLVKYRQHDKNAVGARRYGFLRALSYLLTPKQKRVERVRLTTLVEQARALTMHEAFLSIDGQSQQLLLEFSDLNTRSLLSRVLWYRGAGVKRCGFLRNLLFLYDVIKLPRRS